MKNTNMRWNYPPLAVKHEGTRCVRCGGSGVYIARIGQATGIDCFKCKGSGRTGREDREAEGYGGDYQEDQARLEEGMSLHLAGLRSLDWQRAHEASEREYS